jgi:adenylosuccinate synthase
MSVREARAVIGAGYGDEGKGLMVDALAAATPGAVVVRSNGGAQAGHTVTLEDGRRHVFHHLGAGALAGAATHLSRFFVSCPMVFEAERQAVAGLGGEGRVEADPRGLVTTPWDILVNQAMEARRGAGRHGSCGMGFGETIERGLDESFTLTVADLSAPGLKQRLEAIRDRWLPRRLAALRLDLDVRETAIAHDPRILAVFMDDCRAFAEQVRPRPDRDLHGRAVIFEGAQGLMLDQAIGAMPHVTRSHTGLANISVIAAEAGIERLRVAYVTRAYATRHGAGPLDGARDLGGAFDIVDATNMPNPWQGALRHAPLDLQRLTRAIASDGALCQGPLALDRRLVVTCLDQARDLVPLRRGDQEISLAADEVATHAARELGLPLLAQGWGATRAGVRFQDNLAAAA